MSLNRPESGFKGYPKKDNLGGTVSANQQKGERRRATLQPGHESPLGPSSTPTLRTLARNSGGPDTGTKGWEGKSHANWIPVVLHQLKKTFVK